MAVTLRRAGPRDAAAVAALTRRAYARWVPVIGREPRPMTADHARAVAVDVVDLAEDDGRLVALVHSVVRADDVLIENLAVEPAEQGRGHGARLLAHVEDGARARGKPAVRLYTNALMAANLAFYAARGYAREHEEPYAGGRVVHLVKTVATPPTHP